MRVLTVRGLRIGEGRPKIIAPIVARTREQAIAQAVRLTGLPVEVAEWRADYLPGNETAILDTLYALRNTLSIPLLFTYRTKNEGGEGDFSPQEYAALCRFAAHSGNADFIDVELRLGDKEISSLVSDIHAAGSLAVISSHDFHHTPKKEQLLKTLIHMSGLGADMPKVACMPNSPQDVLELLTASEEFSRITDRPFLAISMGAMGAVSRIAGESFGSCLTFGAAEESSAPGQIPVNELRHILEALHGGR